MKKVCKNCKWWKRLEGKIYPGHTGDCNCEKWVEADGYVVCPIDGVEYWDFEGYSAGFYTGEDFGCIHWEVKDDTCL